MPTMQPWHDFFILTGKWAFPAAALAAGLLGHLVVGVRNAWDIADWLATRQ